MNIAVSRTLTPAEQALADDFAARVAALTPAYDRQALFDRFTATGLPHRRIEEWKYTDMRARLRHAPPAGRFHVDLPVPVASASARPLNAEDGATLSSRFTGFDSPLIDLTAAFVDAGAVLMVDDGAEISAPLALAFSHGAQQRVHGAAIYVIGADASATIVETVGSQEQGAQAFYNGHLSIGEGANVTLVRHIQAGDDGLHAGSLAVTMAANASFTMLLVADSGELVRTDIGLRFTGEGASADLRGLHLGGRQRHIDTTLFVDHAVPNCVSRELFKAVLDDRARSVFQGKILVRQPAQKTDGQMMAQALMLSDEAEADSKPELEIYADDVQCGHGSTTGQIDDNLLFYLLARGIPRQQAQAMLVAAFAHEVFDDLDETLAARFAALADDWLQRHVAEKANQ